MFHRILPAFLVIAVVVCVVSPSSTTAQNTQPPVPTGLAKYEFGINVTMLPGATGSLKLTLVGTGVYSIASPSQAKVRLSGSP